MTKGLDIALEGSPLFEALSAELKKQGADPSGTITIDPDTELGKLAMEHLGLTREQMAGMKGAQIKASEELTIGDLKAGKLPAGIIKAIKEGKLGGTIGDTLAQANIDTTRDLLVTKVFRPALQASVKTMEIVAGVLSGLRLLMEARHDMGDLTDGTNETFDDVLKAIRECPHLNETYVAEPPQPEGKGANEGEGA